MRTSRALVVVLALGFGSSARGEPLAVSSPSGKIA
jgi:hypothetical protein